MKAYLIVASYWSDAYPEDNSTKHTGVAFVSEDLAKTEVTKLTKRDEDRYRNEWRKMSNEQQQKYITSCNEWEREDFPDGEELYIHTKPEYGYTYSYQEITIHL